ncbi:MAG: hypothetical protein ACREJD_01645 [Phycisphaerales bacterium]
MVRCLLAGLVLVSVPSLAPAQPPVPQQATVEQVPFDKTIRAYRSGPVAEGLQIRVKDDHGHERRSEIVVKVDAGGDQGPLRARFDLGELSISIEGDKMVAMHRLEKNRFAEFTLAKGPLLASLESVMPALMLPQLVLADRGTNRLDDLGLLPAGAQVHWEPGVVDRPTGRLLFNGASGDSTMKMLVDRNSGRLASLQVASASGPIRNIDMTARSISPGESESWMLDIAGRQRVDALSDLTTEVDQVRVGAQFPPTMTLLTTGLSQWKEVRDDLASVLVFSQVDTSKLDDSTPEIRDQASHELSRDTRVARQLVRRLEGGSKDRWIARSIAIIPPEGLKLEITSILLTAFDPTESSVLSEPDNMPLVAVSQTFDYDPILGGGPGGVVILDKSRIVRAIITLGDLESTEKKIRDVLETLK